MDLEILIIQILSRHHPREMYGLDIVRESGGKISRGYVYILLGRMEEEGYVESRKDDTPLSHPSLIPRRLYRLGKRRHKEESNIEFFPADFGLNLA